MPFCEDISELLEPGGCGAWSRMARRLECSIFVAPMMGAGVRPKGSRSRLDTERYQVPEGKSQP